MEAFQLRLWDGRIGRWLSPDLYGQYASPYIGMGNNPVNLTDPDGGFAGGPGDPPKSWFGRMFSSVGNFFSGTPEKTYDGGTLKEVVIKNNYHKPKYYGSGAYGWNDGSAESLWNNYMPLTSSFHKFYTGAKTGDKSQMAWGAAFLAIDAFTFGEGSIGIKAATETYALTAAKSGFYPVMTKGFAKATELVYLEKGEVWKYGVTKNPFTRYTQKYLYNLGENGVQYKTLFESSLRSEALTVEKMMIKQYEALHGVLPAGNKVRF